MERLKLDKQERLAVASRALFAIGVLGCVVLAVITPLMRHACFPFMSLFREIGRPCPLITSFLFSLPMTFYFVFFLTMFLAFLLREQFVQSHRVTLTINVLVLAAETGYLILHAAAMFLVMFSFFTNPMLR